MSATVKFFPISQAKNARIRAWFGSSPWFVQISYGGKSFFRGQKSSKFSVIGDAGLYHIDINLVPNEVQTAFGLFTDI